MAMPVHGHGEERVYIGPHIHPFQGGNVLGHLRRNAPASAPSSSKLTSAFESGSAGSFVRNRPRRTTTMAMQSEDEEDDVPNDTGADTDSDIQWERDGLQNEQNVVDHGHNNENGHHLPHRHRSVKNPTTNSPQSKHRRLFTKHASSMDQVGPVLGQRLPTHAATDGDFTSPWQRLRNKLSNLSHTAQSPKFNQSSAMNRQKRANNSAKTKSGRALKPFSGSFGEETAGDSTNSGNFPRPPPVPPPAGMVHPYVGTSAGGTRWLVDQNQESYTSATAFSIHRALNLRIHNIEQNCFGNGSDPELGSSDIRQSPSPVLSTADDGGSSASELQDPLAHDASHARQPSSPVSAPPGILLTCPEPQSTDHNRTLEYATNHTSPTIILSAPPLPMSTQTSESKVTHIKATPSASDAQKASDSPPPQAILDTEELTDTPRTPTTNPDPQQAITSPHSTPSLTLTTASKRSLFQSEQTRILSPTGALSRDIESHDGWDDVIQRLLKVHGDFNVSSPSLTATSSPHLQTGRIRPGEVSHRTSSGSISTSSPEQRPDLTLPAPALPLSQASGSSEAKVRRTEDQLQVPPEPSIVQVEGNGRETRSDGDNSSPLSSMVGPPSEQPLFARSAPNVTSTAGPLSSFQKTSIAGFSSSLLNESSTAAKQVSFASDIPLQRGRIGEFHPQLTFSQPFENASDPVRLNDAKLIDTSNRENDEGPVSDSPNMQSLPAISGPTTHTLPCLTQKEIAPSTSSSGPELQQMTPQIDDPTRHIAIRTEKNPKPIASAISADAPMSDFHTPPFKPSLKKTTVSEPYRTPARPCKVLRFDRMLVRAEWTHLTSVPALWDELAAARVPLRAVGAWTERLVVIRRLAAGLLQLELWAPQGIAQKAKEQVKGSFASSSSSSPSTSATPNSSASASSSTYSPQAFSYARSAISSVLSLDQALEEAPSVGQASTHGLTRVNVIHLGGKGMRKKVGLSLYSPIDFVFALTVSSFPPHMSTSATLSSAMHKAQTHASRVKTHAAKQRSPSPKQWLPTSMRLGSQKPAGAGTSVIGGGKYTLGESKWEDTTNGMHTNLLALKRSGGGTKILLFVPPSHASGLSWIWTLRAHLARTGARMTTPVTTSITSRPPPEPTYASHSSRGTPSNLSTESEGDKRETSAKSRKAPSAPTYLNARQVPSRLDTPITSYLDVAVPDINVRVRIPVPAHDNDHARHVLGLVPETADEMHGGFSLGQGGNNSRPHGDTISQSEALSSVPYPHNPGNHDHGDGLGYRLLTPSVVRYIVARTMSADGRSGAPNDPAESWANLVTQAETLGVPLRLAWRVGARLEWVPEHKECQPGHDQGRHSQLQDVSPSTYGNESDSTDPDRYAVIKGLVLATREHPKPKLEIRLALHTAHSLPAYYIGRAVREVGDMWAAESPNADRSQSFHPDLLPVSLLQKRQQEQLTHLSGPALQEEREGNETSGNKTSKSTATPTTSPMTQSRSSASKDNHPDDNGGFTSGKAYTGKEEIEEPPGAEGYLWRVRPVTGTLTRIYAILRQGRQFFCPLSKAYPPPLALLRLLHLTAQGPPNELICATNAAIEQEGEGTIERTNGQGDQASRKQTKKEMETGAGPPSAPILSSTSSPLSAGPRTRKRSLSTVEASADSGGRGHLLRGLPTCTARPRSSLRSASRNSENTQERPGVQSRDMAESHTEDCHHHPGSAVAGWNAERAYLLDTLLRTFPPSQQDIVHAAVEMPMGHVAMPALVSDLNRYLLQLLRLLRLDVTHYERSRNTGSGQARATLAHLKGIKAAYHAYEQHRQTLQLQNAEGFVDVSDLVFSGMVRGEVPRSALSDCGGQEGLAQAGSAENQAELQSLRQLEIVLANGQRVVLEAYSVMVAVRWAELLRAHSIYDRAQAKVFSSDLMRLASFANTHAHHGPAWGEMSYTLGKVWTWCPLTACYAVRYMGPLFRKHSARKPFERRTYVLTRGLLTGFMITHSQQTARTRLDAGIFHKRVSSVPLRGAFVYSGALALEWIPRHAQHAAPATSAIGMSGGGGGVLASNSESGTGNYQPSSAGAGALVAQAQRVYEDGLQASEAQADCLFVIRYRSPPLSAKSSSQPQASDLHGQPRRGVEGGAQTQEPAQADAEQGTKKTRPESDMAEEAERRNAHPPGTRWDGIDWCDKHAASLVLLARSRAERDLWVKHIAWEIERIEREEV